MGDIILPVAPPSSHVPALGKGNVATPVRWEPISTADWWTGGPSAVFLSFLFQMGVDLAVSPKCRVIGGGGEPRGTGPPGHIRL